MNILKLIFCGAAVAAYAGIADSSPVDSVLADSSNMAPTANQVPSNPAPVDPMPSNPAQPNQAVNPVPGNAPVIYTPAPAPRQGYPNANPRYVNYVGNVDHNPPAAETGRNGHNAFFLAINLGVRYEKLSYREYKEFWDEESESWIIGDKGNSSHRSFKGYGPDFGVKIGGIISSRFALFCNLEFASLNGDFKASRTVDGKKKSHADFETDAIRFALGIGTEFFLTTDTTSILQGVFVGVTANIIVNDAGLISSSYDHEELEISDTGLAFGLELGKVWPVSETWNVGLIAKGAIEGAVRDGDSGNNSDCYSLAVSLVAIRK